VSALDDNLAPRIQHELDSYLGENGGGMVTSFYFVAEFIDPDGDQSWVYCTAPDQRMNATFGLLKWAMGCAEYEQRRYLDEMGEG
jgi:hypothetical protein